MRNIILITGFYFFVVNIAGAKPIATEDFTDLTNKFCKGPHKEACVRQIVEKCTPGVTEKSACEAMLKNFMAKKEPTPPRFVPVAPAPRTLPPQAQGDLKTKLNALLKQCGLRLRVKMSLRHYGLVRAKKEADCLAALATKNRRTCYQCLQRPKRRGAMNTRRRVAAAAAIACVVRLDGPVQGRYFKVQGLGLGQAVFTLPQECGTQLNDFVGMYRKISVQPDYKDLTPVVLGSVDDRDFKGFFKRIVRGLDRASTIALFNAALGLARADRGRQHLSDAGFDTSKVQTYFRQEDYRGYEIRLSVQANVDQLIAQLMQQLRELREKVETLSQNCQGRSNAIPPDIQAILARISGWMARQGDINKALKARLDALERELARLRSKSKLVSITLGTGVLGAIYGSSNGTMAAAYYPGLVVSVDWELWLNLFEIGVDLAFSPLMIKGGVFTRLGGHALYKPASWFHVVLGGGVINEGLDFLTGNNNLAMIPYGLVAFRFLIPLGSNVKLVFTPEFMLGARNLATIQGTVVNNDQRLWFGFGLNIGFQF